MTPLASLLFAFAIQVPQEPAQLEQQAAQLVESQPAEAVAILRRAVAQREAANDGPDAMARALNSLAFALSKAQQHQDATAAGERALTIARSVKDPSEATASIRRNLAEISDKAERLTTASAYAEAAVIDAEAIWGKTPLTAEFREYAAVLALRLGKSKAATSHLGWAIAIYEKVLGKTSPGRVASPSAMLANLLREQGRRTLAWQLYDYAIGALEKDGKAGSAMWRTLMETRSAVLQELGEFELARQTLQRTIKTTTQASAATKPDWLQWSSRWLMLEQGKAARATMARAPATADDPAERWMLQAQLELCEGQWRAALSACDQAEAQLRKNAAASPELVGGESISVELAWLRAKARTAVGEHDANEKDLLQVLNIERQLWGEDSSRSLRTFDGLLSSAVATAMAASQPTPELIDFLDMRTASARWLLPRTLATLHDRNWLANQGLEHQATELDIATDGWLLLAAQRPKRRAACFEALDQLRQRARASASAVAIERAAFEPGRAGLLRDLLQVLAAEPATKKDGREDLHNRFAPKLASLRIEQPQIASRIAPTAAKLSVVRKQLAARGQGMLQLSCTQSRITAWWLPPVGEMRIVALGTRAEIEKNLQEAQRALHQDGDANLAAISKSLLAPLWPELAAQQDVVVIANGPLQFLPFAALPTPAGTPWVQSARISYANSAQEWLRYRTLPNGRSTSGHLQRGAGQTSNPQFGRVLKRMPPTTPAGPQTGLAVQRTIAKEEPQVRTERQLRAAQRDGSLQNLRLFEISAPTYIDCSAPAATGILLGVEPQQQQPLWERDDGWLDAAELSTTRIDTDVAAFWASQCVLPSNRTPRAAGLQELLAATFDAGAGSVVLAGWAPNDRLCTSFENLVRAELKKGDVANALLRAQREWLKRAEDNAKMQSPHIWARLRFWGR